MTHCVRNVPGECEVDVSALCAELALAATTVLQATVYF